MMVTFLLTQTLIFAAAAVLSWAYIFVFSHVYRRQPTDMLQNGVNITRYAGWVFVVFFWRVEGGDAWKAGLTIGPKHLRPPSDYSDLNWMWPRSLEWRPLHHIRRGQLKAWG